MTREFDNSGFIGDAENGASHRLYLFCCGLGRSLESFGLRQTGFPREAGVNLILRGQRRDVMHDRVKTLFSYDDSQAINWLNVQAADANFSWRKMEARSVLNAARKLSTSSTTAQGVCQSER